MSVFNKRNILIFLIGTAVVVSTAFFGLQISKFNSFGNSEVLHKLSFGVINVSDVPLAELAPLPPKKLSNPPEIIKAVYVTGWSAGSSKYLNYLDKLFTNTEINAVVIDIKDYSGLVSYRSGAIKDIDSLVRYLHSKNIYVIGRISVFEDPVFAKAKPELAVQDKINGGLWKDNNGLYWLDPTSKEVWDYNISIAKDVFFHGFDEVNFDYVRFPSDGKTESIEFPVWDGIKPKPEVIKEFFEYTRAQLAGEAISADLFGQTTTNRDDMGIGQIIENAFENFDYVCPMIYPSHYIYGFLGFNNPAEHPYEIVKYSLDTALARQGKLGGKLRPWLQDFDMGANYTVDMVQAEIKAVKDAMGENYAGYMLWNSSNIYTQEAVLK